MIYDITGQITIFTFKKNHALNSWATVNCNLQTNYGLDQRKLLYINFNEGLLYNFLLLEPVLCDSMYFNYFMSIENLVLGKEQNFHIFSKIGPFLQMEVSVEMFL